MWRKKELLMRWWEKIFSIRNYREKKQITMFGLRMYARKSSYWQILQVRESLQDILYKLAYFQARDFFKQHYKITIPAECCGIGMHFELVKLKLKDIKRMWTDGKMYDLEQCSPYRYLQTRNPGIYQNYLHKLEQASPHNRNWSMDTFNKLENSVSNVGYDPAISAIAVNRDNVLIDGQHRCALLLKQYGPEYEVFVVRVY